MNLRNYIKLAVSILVTVSAGIIGSFFTTSAITTWYADLLKPTLNPPNWIFGPVWTLLYILMGIALFIVWKRYEKIKFNKKLKTVWHWGIVVFISQLILNTFWSIIFFRLESPGWALIEISFLWALILLTIVLFFRLSKLAGWLLVPYILWVTFAIYLNYSIWLLN